jgi:hypothetical protein
MCHWSRSRACNATVVRRRAGVRFTVLACGARLAMLPYEPGRQRVWPVRRVLAGFWGFAVCRSPAGRRTAAAGLRLCLVRWRGRGGVAGGPGACWRPTGFVDNYIMPLVPFSCQFRVHTRRASDTPVPSESSDDCSTLPRTRTKPASHARRSSMHAGG